MTISVEQARFNMVEQQIRTWNVLDNSVLDLLFHVKREEYVPSTYRLLAFSELEIPLGSRKGQKMWQPKLEARVLQELKVRSTDHVLEIGTGSGYLAALLAQKSSRVTTVEIDPALCARAKELLAQQGLSNVDVVCGDAAQGWAEGTSYDVIVVTGSTPVLPDGLLRQLRVKGRLFAVVGDEPVMSGRLVTRGMDSQLVSLDLFETLLDPLTNAAQPERFVF